MATSEVEATEIVRRARAGDVEAVEALISLVSTHPGLSSDPQRAWPSIQALVNRLEQEHRTLSCDDTDLARQICLEISENTDLIPFLDVPVSKVQNVMKRVLLYADSKIVIRAHLFDSAMSETFIHNHGQAMISTCLEGSYVHKIYQINEVSGHHYRFTRKPGGFIEEECERVEGEIENILCQPFQAGQSLFISALAQHTVAGTSAKLSTITIRDAQKRFETSHLLSERSSVDEDTTDHVDEITDREEQRKVKSQLKSALVRFRGRLIQHPAMDTYLEAVSSQVAATHTEVLRTRDMTTQILEELQNVNLNQNRESEDGAREREREGTREALIFCGNYLPYLAFRGQAIPGVHALRDNLRGECRRHGVPQVTLDHFFNAPVEKFHLLAPHLPRDFELFLTYFRRQMGAERSLPQVDEQLVEARLAVYDYPRAQFTDMPLERRRMECMLWISRFGH